VNITVNPVASDNVAPVVRMTGTRARFVENTPAAVDSGIRVWDLNNANLVSATVAISGGYTAGQDVLNFQNQNDITGSWDATTGVLTLSGSAPPAVPGGPRSVTSQQARLPICARSA
jgi:hypothetical protein